MLITFRVQKALVMLYQGVNHFEKSVEIKRFMGFFWDLWDLWDFFGIYEIYGIFFGDF